MASTAPIAALAPVHPGAFLSEVILPALPQSKSEVARLLGISRRALYNVLEGKSDVTPDLALRLGKLLGNGGEFWMNLQVQYSLKVAGERLAAELASIPTLDAA